jgi:universal stress protein A
MLEFLASCHRSALQSLPFVDCFLLAIWKRAHGLIHSDKKCTLFSKAGAVFSRRARHSMRMKTEEKLVRTKPTGIALKRILVPIDFSPLSKKAVQYARPFAEEFRAGLTLLHVIEPDVPPAFDRLMIAPQLSPNGNRTKCANRLKTLASSMVVRATNYVQCTVRTGLAAHEIVEAAKEFDTDLIVMATHGYTGWKHFAIGSTAERVVRAAPCPVLVVREREHEFV